MRQFGGEGTPYKSRSGRSLLAPLKLSSSLKGIGNEKEEQIGRGRSLPGSISSINADTLLLFFCVIQRREAVSSLSEYPSRA